MAVFELLFAVVLMRFEEFWELMKMDPKGRYVNYADHTFSYKMEKAVLDVGVSMEYVIEAGKEIKNQWELANASFIPVRDGNGNFAPMMGTVRRLECCVEKMAKVNQDQALQLRLLQEKSIKNEKNMKIVLEMLTKLSNGGNRNHGGDCNCAGEDAETAERFDNGVDIQREGE